MGEQWDVELVHGIAQLTCVFCVQVAVPPAQPAQHCQRCQAELLTAKAAGPEAAEAACCCHPSHREYPTREGWLGLRARRPRARSSTGLSPACRASVLRGCACPCGWPSSWSAGSRAWLVQAPQQQGALSAERVPSCWSSSASNVWMSLELFYQKVVGGLDRKSFSLPHDCCLPLL